MVSGECVAISTLHKALPSIMPRPITWGTYSADPDIHFFLCEFVTITNDIPDTEQLGEALVKVMLPNVA